MGSSEILSNTPNSAKKPKFKKPGSPGVLGYGLPAAFAAFDAYGRIQEGEDFVPAVGKAVGSAILGDMAMSLLSPTAAATLFFGQLAVAGGSLLIEHGKGHVNNLSKAMGKNKSSNVINSRNAVTMRQRGMAMINNSGEVTRSALGSEARAYFRSSVDY